MEAERRVGRSVSRRKTAQNVTFCIKKERDVTYRKIYSAVQKGEADRSEEEKELLRNNEDLVEKALQSQKKREEVKARSEEVEDPEHILLPKCEELAAALRNSHQLVVYTGAGISTAAKIPDYRGTNGIWTLLQKGKDIGKHDLSQAEPTLTHMALFELYSQGILKYVVSQNCDGLHLRSGLPRTALSEVHGNMHLEVCRECRPGIQYWRMFDVTENTGRFSHRTMRRCHVCHAALIDTIVHFGERGNLPWPLNWPAACKAADNADVILCIGSSLKVLKKYPWLWGMDKPVRKRPKLYIINLQWTPKDDQAVLKINGRCDRVMQEVMRFLKLQIPTYDRLRDPIFCHATHLHPEEIHTTSQPELDSPFKQEIEEKSEELRPIVLKRTNLSQLDEGPSKVRKTDECIEKFTTVVVKCEEGSGGNDATSMDILDSSDFLKTKSVSVNVNLRTPGSIDCENLKEFIPFHTLLTNPCLSTSELKLEDPSENCSNGILDPLSNILSSEEVVNQVFTYDGNMGSFYLESKLNDSLVVTVEKEEDEEIIALPVDGQEFSLFPSSIPFLCSKNSPQGNSACSIDGKENVALNGLRPCSAEAIKIAKKSEIEGGIEYDIDSDVLHKARTSTIVVVKSESGKISPCDSRRDACMLNKSLKVSGRNHAESIDEEMGVLRMLQLEHNYSKSFDLRDEKGEESNGKAVELVKNEVRKMSEDSHSLRMSSRVRGKQNASLPACSQSKLMADEKSNHAEAVPFTPKSNKPSNPLKNKKLTKADFEMRSELRSRICSFCLKYYTSKSCLFYPSWDSHQWKFEGCICECCDYSSDSEELEEEGSSGEAGENKGDSTDNAEEGTTKSSVINPGWYGKGYRKRFRKRK